MLAQELASKGGESTEDHEQLRVVAHGFRAVRVVEIGFAGFVVLNKRSRRCKQRNG